MKFRCASSVAGCAGLVSAAAFCFLLSDPVAAQSIESVAPGSVIVEPPTLRSLGFEWPIEGDDNRDATAWIEYRKSGEETWHQGLPLLRLHAERTVFWDSLDYTAPNMFAGSLLNLEPDTAYVVRLTLTDPDGVHGDAQRIVSVSTRAEPQVWSGGATYHVYPPGYDGPMEQPAFGGLLAAYYTAALGGDWSRASPPRVQPGDRIVVHAGVYKDDRTHYSHEIMSDFTTCCGTPWNGTYFLSQGGTAERPISIVAAGDGEVIFDGDGNDVLFNVMAADYLHFEGITFRNTTTAIEAGQKHIAGSIGLVVKRSRFEDVGIAIHSDWSGSAEFFIADNVMIGRQPTDEVYGWVPQAPWVDRRDYDEKKRLRSYYAVAIYGAGHVVAYNYVTGFHDAIDHATYGMPDDFPNTPRERMPVSIDFHNNDVNNVHDNCFEADGGMHNVRIFENRCFNAATGAMSPQPIFGGPVYFFRNVVYNGVYGPLKIHGNPSGILVFQNTYIGEIAMLSPASNMHFRNNLILGQGTRPAVMAIDTYTNYSSSDYNGFRPNPESEIAFQWTSPSSEVLADYEGERTVRQFATFAEYAEATGQDENSRLVDYDVFVDAPMPNYRDPTRPVDPDSVDLRLRADSLAIDAGIELPGITDGYRGAAPDLGAYELGTQPPHYGPRPAANH